VVGGQKVEQVGHSQPPSGTEVPGGVDLIGVPAADPAAGDEPAGHEVTQDHLRRPLADADVMGHVDKPDIGVVRDPKQHGAVIRQEAPVRSAATARTA
jgi:hypothetical protein